jgi:uncharacterized membrane protein
MAKANQSQNHELVPVNAGGTDKKQKQMWISRAMVVVGACLLMSVALIGSASASESAINWTEMTNLLGGLAGIMPAFAALIMAVVPIILVVVVIGFAIGLLDGILEGVTNALSFMKRK